MEYEVELKFRLDGPQQLSSISNQLGLEFSETLIQVDRYFNHPCKDFRQTDEAFRLRQVGERNLVTYKGPRIDKQTKTRRELELCLPSGQEAGEQQTMLWQALGFREAGTVRKSRREAGFQWRSRAGHIAHDQVDALGEFIELEFICREEDVDSAREDALELARQLGLTQPEHRSYLELLSG